MKDIDSIKEFMMEDEEEDLLEADLKTILTITGSYLYSGADLHDVDETVFLRILELTKVYLAEAPMRIPLDETVH